MKIHNISEVFNPLPVRAEVIYGRALSSPSFSAAGAPSATNKFLISRVRKKNKRGRAARTCSDSIKSYLI